MRRLGRWQQRAMQAVAPAIAAAALGWTAPAAGHPTSVVPLPAERPAQPVATLLPRDRPQSATSTSIRPARAKATPLVVVGLGDSVPLGRACNCTSYVSASAQRLAATQGRPPVVYNNAASGATSADVWRQLQTSTALGRQIAASDLVIVQVGANDFDEALAYDQRCQPAATSSCYASTLRRVRINVTQIVTAIRAAQAKPAARVIVMGYWNVFRDGVVARAQGNAYVAGSEGLTAALNERFRQLTSIRGVLYADAYTPFKGTGGRDATPYLAPDADHPNAAGHLLLTNAVIAALGRSAATV